ncbi:MAG: circadian clock KaiB family protein [Myxococcota bacterium]
MTVRKLGHTHRPSRVLLCLYVSGQSPHSQRALRNLGPLCAEALGEGYELEVVDVLENPEAADRAGVVATPTLVRVHPPPLRKLLGDMSDRSRVLGWLDPNAP